MYTVGRGVMSGCNEPTASTKEAKEPMTEEVSSDSLMPSSFARLMILSSTSV